MTTYKVLSIPHVTDGDTLWVQRERLVGRAWGFRKPPADRLLGEAEGMELIARPRVMWSGTDLFIRDYAGGTKVRLHDGGKGLQCPEKNINRLGWNTARNDLLAYVGQHALTDGTLAVPMELVTFGRDKYGRLLGNLVLPGYDETHSAVFHMKDRGWEAYR